MAEVASQIVAWLSLPLLAVIAGLLIWRKAAHEFPYFLSYIIVGQVVGLARFWAFHLSRPIYYYTYWISDSLFSAAAFLATYELFIKRLFPRFYRVRSYRYLFPAVAALACLGAVPVALQTHRISTLLSVLLAIDVVRIVVLSFFMGLMILMRRTWTRYEFGIAAGLGIQASALLITFAVRARQPFVRHVLDQLPVITFDLACIIWLVTFLKPEKPTTVPSGPISPELLTEARKWQEAAKGSVSGKKDPD